MTGRYAGSRRLGEARRHCYDRDDHHDGAIMHATEGVTNGSWSTNRLYSGWTGGRPGGRLLSHQKSWPDVDDDPRLADRLITFTTELHLRPQQQSLCPPLVPFVLLLTALWPSLSPLLRSRHLTLYHEPFGHAVAVPAHCISPPVLTDSHRFRHLASVPRFLLSALASLTSRINTTSPSRWHARTAGSFDDDFITPPSPRLSRNF
nr:hypothetical protein CFP56_52726 [Quercus suber]